MKAPREGLNMKSRLPRRRAVFAWDMHYSCNFSCGYCFYTTTGWSELAKKNRYRTPEEWEIIWGRIHRKYGRCQLRITAGEPFTYPRFPEVVAGLSRLHDMQITTNGSRADALRRFARDADPSAVELDCTFHPRSMDFDEFAENVAVLRRGGFTANVCYLAHPSQLEPMAGFKERFAQKDIRMNLAIFWGAYGGKEYPFSYTEAERELIRRVTGSAKGPETVNLDPIRVGGKICGAGQRYAVVQADGRVYRCGQLCVADGCMGEMFDENFSLDAEAKPCPADYCRCKEYQSAWSEKDRELMDHEKAAAAGKP